MTPGLMRFASLPGNRNLLFRVRKETIPAMSSLGYLAAVNVVIWVGLFFYLWRLDRRLAQREREE